MNPMQWASGSARCPSRCAPRIEEAALRSIDPQLHVSHDVNAPDDL
jgi:hypothetical protein